MTLRMGALSDALLAAGVKPGLARAADKEALGDGATFEARFVTLETRIVRVGRRLDVLLWLAGTNLALTAAVLFKLLH